MDDPVPRLANNIQVEHIGSTVVLTFRYKESVGGIPATVLARVVIPRELAPLLQGKLAPPTGSSPGSPRWSVD